MAASLGYDGVEVMVWTDPVSQDVAALKVLVRPLRRAGRLGARAVPAGHPAGVEPGSVGAAAPLGRCSPPSSARPTVVVHPPFTWQRDYARGFAAGLRHAERGVPGHRLRGREHVPGAGAGAGVRAVPARAGIRPRPGFDAYTLDLSHCAAARSDALAMADAMGAGLAHVHLGDGTGEGRDEHLVPGRGTQPCARAARVAGARAGSPARSRSRWPPGGPRSRAARQDDLAASLAFARAHLAAPSTVDA